MTKDTENTPLGATPLERCPACAGSVPRYGATCPHCGRVDRIKQLKDAVLVFLVGVVPLLALLAVIFEPWYWFGEPLPDNLPDRFRAILTTDVLLSEKSHRIQELFDAIRTSHKSARPESYKAAVAAFISELVRDDVYATQSPEAIEEYIRLLSSAIASYPSLSTMGFPNCKPVDIVHTLVSMGYPRTESFLIDVMWYVSDKGDDEYAAKEIAEVLLNSGNPLLGEAAGLWASEHGYTKTSPVPWGSTQWGTGRRP